MTEFLSDTLGDSESPLDTLPITDDDHSRLAGVIDRATTSWADDHRRHVRIRYEQVSLIAIDLFTLTGEAKRYKVKPRNISNGGINFLHDAEAPAGSACRVTLVARDDRAMQVDGKVKRCTNVLGNIYEIAVRFDGPVDAFGLLEGDAVE